MLKNQSQKGLTGCVLDYAYPRELEFISSNPDTTVSSGSIHIPIGNIIPGGAFIVSLNFRVMDIPISGDGTPIICNATASANEVNTLTESASIIYRTLIGTIPLQVNITWESTDSGIILEVLPFGGSSPYDVKIYWGDGETDFSTTSGDPIGFNHEWKTTGEYSIRVTTSDSFGRNKIVERTVSY